MDRQAEREFELFVSTNGASLLRLAFGLTGDRGAAEDLLQTALTKTFLAWGRVSAAGDPAAYVRRVLVNAHISSWRRRRIPENLTPGVTDPHDGSAPYEDLSADRDLLRSALERLGRRQRAVVLLRYLEDWPDEDIAKALGCTTGTVRSQAFRALAILRDLPEFDSHRPRAATTSREGL